MKREDIVWPQPLGWPEERFAQIRTGGAMTNAEMEQFTPRRKATFGDRRISYWREDGKKVDFDPTEPDRREEERLDRIEAAQWRLFEPRYRKWQAEMAKPWRCP